MSRVYHWIAISVLISCAALTIAQSTRVSRCYKFTWLGPRWNNQSVFLNATCMEATRLSDGIPCQEPLVVSYDGTWPDVEYIWTNYREHASCVLAETDVCAQYTYSFNGRVENSTYMCTKAIDTEGAAITSGCYEQINGSFSTKVCFCRTVPGGVPCNNNATTSIISVSIIFFSLLINKNFVKLLL